MTRPVLPGEVLCECGHPALSHHGTSTGNVTYCTVWDPQKCPCKRHKEAP